MNILKKIFSAKKDDVAWQSDEPTPFVIDCYKKGFIKNGNTAIDIGCGFGRNSNWLASHGVNVTAVNIDKDEVFEAKRKAEQLNVTLEYILTDILSLDLKEKSYDVILDLGCSHMLSMSDQLIFEKKVARLAKSGGILIFFGFSKKHPSYDVNNKLVMYRDIDDILKTYGNDFEVISQTECRWKPKPEENSKYQEHVGLNIIMRRK
jgi:2-polyprenyl-3-methyl-5-hydroxy-6-metoxy-1,4-benzoquinol methylase